MEYNYKFCILAAGRGIRNKSVSGLHKALLPIENRPALSHILERIPIDVEIIIAVGYKSNQIKSYTRKVHPKRKITYVDVENFEGPGSGPGLSLFSCSKELQCPFIFTSSDTLTEESYNYSELKYNWVGYDFLDEKVKRTDYTLIDGDEILNKFYWGEGNKAFIGIAGIYDYKNFWEGFVKDKSLMKQETQVFNGFNNIHEIHLKPFTWYDTGDPASYDRTKTRFHHEIVANKVDEALFVDEGKVIKYFSDSEKIKQRILRVTYLNGTCPDVTQIDENMYSYDYVDGRVLSKIYDENILNKLLPYWYNKLASNKFDKTIHFLNNCKYIYHDKTFDRCKKFSMDDIDNIEFINGIKVEKINDMLEKIDWEKIYDCATPSNFHGDLQPENIIYNGENFTLIDWRESFGDSLVVGDIYYDLGKLYHALYINGTDVNSKLYHLEIKNNEAYVYNHIRSNLFFLLRELKKWCKMMNYSWENIQLLGTLQYLNICCLYDNFHNGEYGKFLFLHGKHQLSKLLNKDIE
jgi:hypothetical protein